MGKNFGDVAGETIQGAGKELMPFLLTQFNLKRQANQDQFNRRIDLNDMKLKVEQAGRTKRAQDFNFERSSELAGREDELFELNAPVREATRGSAISAANVSKTGSDFLLENPNLITDPLVTKAAGKVTKPGQSAKSVGFELSGLLQKESDRTTKFNEAQLTRAQKKKKAGVKRQLQGILDDPLLTEDERTEQIKGMKGLSSDLEPLDFGIGDFSEDELGFRTTDTLGITENFLEKKGRKDPRFDIDSAEVALEEAGLGDFLEREFATPQKTQFSDSEIPPEIQTAYNKGGEEEQIKIVVRLMYETYPELKEKDRDDPKVQEELNALLNHFMAQLDAGMKRGVERSKQKRSGKAKSPATFEMK